MNIKHPNIRFTLESEDKNENSFSFLDIKTIKTLRKNLLKH